MSSPITFRAPCPRDSSSSSAGPSRTGYVVKRSPQRAGDGIPRDQPAQLVRRHRGQQQVTSGETVWYIAPDQPRDAGQRTDGGRIDGHRREIAAERTLLATGIAFLLRAGRPLEAGDPGLDVGENRQARLATRRGRTQP